MGRQPADVCRICCVNDGSALPLPVDQSAPRQRGDMRRQCILPHLKRLGDIARRHSMTLARQQTHYFPACWLAKGAQRRDSFNLIHTSGIIDMNDSRVTIN